MAHPDRPWPPPRLEFESAETVRMRQRAEADARMDAPSFVASFAERAFPDNAPSGFRPSYYVTTRAAAPPVYVPPAIPRTCQNCGARSEVVRCSYCRKPV